MDGALGLCCDLSKYVSIYNIDACMCVHGLVSNMRRIVTYIVDIGSAVSFEPIYYVRLSIC